MVDTILGRIENCQLKYRVRNLQIKIFSGSCYLIEFYDLALHYAWYILQVHFNHSFIFLL